MKNVHYGHCLIGIALAVALLIAVGVSASTLGFLAVAAICPIVMVVMMRAMGDSGPRASKDPVDQDQLR